VVLAAAWFSLSDQRGSDRRTLRCGHLVPSVREDPASVLAQRTTHTPSTQHTGSRHSQSCQTMEAVRRGVCVCVRACCKYATFSRVPFVTSSDQTNIFLCNFCRELRGLDQQQQQQQQTTEPHSRDSELYGTFLKEEPDAGTRDGLTLEDEPSVCRRRGGCVMCLVGLHRGGGGAGVCLQC